MRGHRRQRDCFPDAGPDAARSDAGAYGGADSGSAAWELREEPRLRNQPLVRRRLRRVVPGEFSGLPLAAVHAQLLGPRAWVRVGDERGRVGERHDPSLAAKARQASSAKLQPRPPEHRSALDERILAAPGLAAGACTVTLGALRAQVPRVYAKNSEECVVVARRWRGGWSRAQAMASIRNRVKLLRASFEAS